MAPRANCTTTVARALPLASWLLLATWLALPTAAVALQSQAQTPYERAIATLDAGDSAAAIAQLRRVIDEDRNHGLALLRLGSLLADGANEAERDFTQRIEAERLLDRAYKILGPTAEMLLEYGLLLRKQGVGVDAMRVLDDATEAAEEQVDALQPTQRARLHYSLGRIYEASYENLDGLVYFTDTAPRLSCSNIPPDQHPPPHAAAVVCPRAWAERYDHGIAVADEKAEANRAQMMRHYLAALEADPRHIRAATAVMVHLAAAGEWDEYADLSRTLLAHAPERGDSHLFHALWLHAVGREAEAAEAFDRGLALLPDEVRQPYNDISLLVDPSARDEFREADPATQREMARTVFTAKDPSFLTEPNERRLEHYARVAFADLRFSAPRSGVRGSETDRGQVWIRYGEPWRTQMVGGGLNRHIYWSYSENGPLFTFEMRLRYRRARIGETAGVLASRLASLAAEAYSPAAISAVHPYPHQLARFRGTTEGNTSVEVYASPPLDSLGAIAEQTLESGIFLFERDYSPIWSRRQETILSGRPIGLSYAVELPPGEFRLGLEARVADELPTRRPLARTRTGFAIEAFEEGSLGLSDLLLAADTIRPAAAQVVGPDGRSIASPVAERADLAIIPLRSTSVPVGDAIHFYFEIYGLTPDEEGVGRFRAELTVDDEEGTGFFARVLRGGLELLGLSSPESQATSWERAAPITGRSVPEYLSVRIPDMEPGEITIRVQVTDLATGDQVERVRTVTIVERSPPREPAVPRTERPR